MRCPPSPSVALACLWCLVFLTPLPAAEPLDYSVPDPQLKVIRLDSSPTDSFLAVRADTAGRLFVGGREALFVYEPDARGGYRPRQLLCPFPNHSWIYDIALRGDDLYVMTDTALYLIPGGVTGRERLQPKRLIWGVPMTHVHQNLHCLAWGPEGDLYFSMGDPLVSYGDFNRPDHWAHWTFFSQPEGTRTPYTGAGGVFRCRPDGSGLRVVAGGTRNSVGLCFDRAWNLFSNDNDHESIPADYVPGRLLHVTPHADFSWPRGWMVEKTPGRADLLQTMFAGMGRAVPVGQAYYGDTLLPPAYHDNLLLARWGIRAVTRYPLKHRGASFQAEEQTLLAGQNQARPVGVAVGRGGRVFVTVAYMPHNDASPTYPSDLVMITRADDAPEHPFEPYEATSASPARLWSELANATWSRREAAHVEILRRGGALLAEATRRLDGLRPDDAALPHLVWLAAASGDERAAVKLTQLAGHADAAVRLQAVRSLAEFPALKAPRELFTKGLTDSDPQVRLATVLAFFDRDGDLPKELLRGPAVSSDTYLRQAATLLLARKAPFDQLRELTEAKDAATRVAGVLAAGFRLTLPDATAPLADHLPLTPRPSREGDVIDYADARIDLRPLGRIGHFTMAEHWKVGKHTAEQERLFALLLSMLGDRDEPVRLQAAHFLFLLNDPRSEPAVARVVKARDERRLALAPLKGIRKLWLAGPFPDGPAGLKTIHPPEQGLIDLTAQYAVGPKRLGWTTVEANGNYLDLAKLAGPCDYSSFYVLWRLESAQRQRIQLLLGSDDGVKVWHNGREVWSNPVVRGALPFEDVVPLDLQPGSNELLVRVQNVTGACGLYLNYRALGPVVLRLPEKLDTATLAERLKSGTGPGQGQIGKEFLEVDWAKTVGQGDAGKGRQLFGSLGCVKCHAVTADAESGGGPSLADARRRFTVPYVVESILLPSKEVSPVFRATLLVTKQGATLTGLVVSETGEKLELLLPDTTRKTVLKNDVEQRTLQNASPMPAGLVKTPAELRDLLAYLLSDNPTPP